MFLIKNEPNTNMTLTWVEGAVSALCHHIIVNKVSCLIIFAGKHINRLPLRKDRELLKEFNFNLIKINSFRLGKSLSWFFKTTAYFTKIICGYTLLATSNKYQPTNIENITQLFNLPYKYIVPIAVLNNQIWYTHKRLHYLISTTQADNINSLGLGGQILFILLTAVHKFLSYNIKILLCIPLKRFSKNI